MKKGFQIRETARENKRAFGGGSQSTLKKNAYLGFIQKKGLKKERGKAFPVVRMKKKI